MDLLETYIIPFSNLEEGKHLFYFTAGEEFFEHFDFHNINGGNIKINVSLEKLSSEMILDFIIKGRINTICDLCLDDLALPIEINDRLFVKFSGLGKEQIDENLIIGIEETQINIIHNIYEIIELNLPIKKIHSADKQENKKCNIKMLNKIEEHSAIKEVKDSSDPRWEKLKDLEL